MGLSFADKALGQPTVLVLSPDDGVSGALAAMLGPHGIHVAIPRLEESVRDAVTRTGADVVLVSSECGDQVVGAIMAEYHEEAPHTGGSQPARSDPPPGDGISAFVPILLFAPDATASALETTGRAAMHGLARRYEVPILELSRDVDSVALQLRLLAGRQPLS